MHFWTGDLASARVEHTKEGGGVVDAPGRGLVGANGEYPFSYRLSASASTMRELSMSIALILTVFILAAPPIDAPDALGQTRPMSGVLTKTHLPQMRFNQRGSEWGGKEVR